MRTYDAWLRAGIDAWSLGLDASAVIGLRMMKIAGGGETGSAEALLMISEKIKAAIDLQGVLVSRGLAASPLVVAKESLRFYHRKVAANRRRLGREARDAPTAAGLRR